MAFAAHWCRSPLAYVARLRGFAEAPSAERFPPRDLIVGLSTTHPFVVLERLPGTRPQPGIRSVLLHATNVDHKAGRRPRGNPPIPYGRCPHRFSALSRGPGFPITADIGPHDGTAGINDREPIQGRHSGCPHILVPHDTRHAHPLRHRRPTTRHPYRRHRVQAPGSSADSAKPHRRRPQLSALALINGLACPSAGARAPASAPAANSPHAEQPTDAHRQGQRARPHLTSVTPPETPSRPIPRSRPAISIQTSSA